MSQFLIKSFWKEQLYNSASKLPEEIIEANTIEDAAIEYINIHYPFLKREISDYLLVLDNMEIYESKDKI